MSGRVKAHAIRHQAGVGAGAYADIARDLPAPVTFLGYDTLESTARVLALLVDGVRVEDAHDGDAVAVVLDRTPFYSEAGGQVGDKGTLDGPIGVVDVVDTQRQTGGSGRPPRHRTEWRAAGRR